MPPKSLQKRVVVESRETRLSKMKHKHKAGLEKLVTGTTSPGEQQRGHAGRPLSAVCHTTIKLFTMLLIAHQFNAAPAEEEGDARDEQEG